MDKDGILMFNDFELFIKKHENLNPDPEVYERYRQALIDYIASYGVKPGISVYKKDYTKMMANHARRELERGEGMLLHRLIHATYDLVDKNKDGTVSKEEYFALGKAAGYEDKCESIFNSLDKNQNGKLERKEVIDYSIRKWYRLDASSPGGDEADSSQTAK